MGDPSDDVAQKYTYVILVGRRSCSIRSTLALQQLKYIYLVNQGKRHSQTVCNGSRSLRSSSIRADDDSLLVCSSL